MGNAGHITYYSHITYLLPAGLDSLTYISLEHDLERIKGLDQQISDETTMGFATISFNNRLDNIED